MSSMDRPRVDPNLDAPLGCTLFATITLQLLPGGSILEKDGETLDTIPLCTRVYIIHYTRRHEIHCTEDVRRFPYRTPDGWEHQWFANDSGSAANLERAVVAEPCDFG